MLIMQRMDYIEGPSAPSASEVEAFDKLFDSNLTASEAEAMGALFLTVEKGSSRKLQRRRATS